MTQHLLDHIQVGAFGQHIRTEGTPELVSGEIVRLTVSIEDVVLFYKVFQPILHSWLCRNHNLTYKVARWTSVNKQHILNEFIRFVPQRFRNFN